MTPVTQRGIGGVRRPELVTRLRSVTPDPIVDGVRGAARVYGTSTAAWRSLPDFLIIGVKKGAPRRSRTGWFAIRRCCPCFRAGRRPKSPHYFDINYWRGENWYRSYFPSSGWPAAGVERRTGRRSMVGDSFRPTTCSTPRRPARIHATIPHVPMIAVLREPVSRAYSNYWDRGSPSGAEDLPTFEAAIDAESERLAGVLDAGSAERPRAYDFDHDNHTYLARGRYAEQLRRYYELFSRDQLLVLTQDEMYGDRAAAFARIQAHLGLQPAAVELAEYNVRKGSNPKIDPETRERLRAYYAPHNAELYDCSAAIWAGDCARGALRLFREPGSESSRGPAADPPRAGRARRPRAGVECGTHGPRG